jgi:hypothetical protein
MGTGGVMTTICPCCGAAGLKNFTEIRKYTPPYGETVEYEVTLQRCSICTEAGDFVGEMSKATEEAIRKADAASMKPMLDALVECGYTYSTMERVLGIRPFGTMKKWYRGESFSTEALALVRIIRTYPWILWVTDEGFRRPSVVQTFAAIIADIVEALTKER